MNTKEVRKTGVLKTVVWGEGGGKEAREWRSLRKTKTCGGGGKVREKYADTLTSAYLVVGAGV